MHTHFSSRMVYILTKSCSHFHYNILSVYFATRRSGTEARYGTRSAIAKDCRILARSTVSRIRRDSETIADVETGATRRILFRDAHTHGRGLLRDDGGFSRVMQRGPAELFVVSPRK